MCHSERIVTMSRFIVVLGLLLLFLGAVATPSIHADEGIVPSHPNLLVGTSQVSAKVHLKGGVSRFVPLIVMFRNGGNATLRWSLYTGSILTGCNIPVPYSWLRFTPNSGYLSPRLGMEARVYVDYYRAGVGTHNGLLCLASNDPDMPIVPIPLHIIVE
jgi:hypothetical protein